MRTLDTAQTEAVEKQSTEPQYLIQIDLDQPYYWSTRADTDYNGNTYYAGSVQLVQISDKTCELRIDNHDYSFTRGCLEGDFLRGEVKIYWAYPSALAPLYVQRGYWQPGYTPEPSDTAPDPILLFDGVIDATPEIDAWISVRCTKTPPRLYPFRKLRPPIANFAPTSGYVLEFDGQILRIET